MHKIRCYVTESKENADDQVDVLNYRMTDRPLTIFEGSLRVIE